MISVVVAASTVACASRRELRKWLTCAGILLPTLLLVAVTDVGGRAGPDGGGGAHGGEGFVVAKRLPTVEREGARGCFVERERLQIFIFFSIFKTSLSSLRFFFFFLFHCHFFCLNPLCFIFSFCRFPPPPSPLTVV